MRFGTPRLLKLRLAGNWTPAALHNRQMTRGCVIGACSASRAAKENKGFRTPQLTPECSPNLGPRFEVQRKHGSNRSGMGVESVGLEPPLPDRISCSAGKGQRTLQELGGLHGTI